MRWKNGANHCRSMLNVIRSKTSHSALISKESGSTALCRIRMRTKAISLAAIRFHLLGSKSITVTTFVSWTACLLSPQITYPILYHLTMSSMINRPVMYFWTKYSRSGVKYRSLIKKLWKIPSRTRPHFQTISRIPKKGLQPPLWALPNS